MADPEAPEVLAAPDPGANTAPTKADKYTMATMRVLDPTERFKTGWVTPGTDIISMGGLIGGVGSLNMARVMRALVTDDLVCILGPKNVTSFVKSGDAGGNFKIVNGNELRAAKAVPSGAYSVSVAAVNSQAETGTTRTVTIFVDPHSPTDIALSAATVANTAAVNTVVGNLTTTDADAGDTFTYTMANPTGEFKIVVAAIQVAKALTGMGGQNITVKVTSTDASGLAVTKSFLIAIT